MSVLLGLILPLLIFAGVLVHNVIADSVRVGHAIRGARADAAAALQLQIDEETGVRGYVATGQKLYLAPYDSARMQIGPTLDDLRAAIEALHDDARVSLALDVDGVRDLNAAWRSTVAQALIADPKSRHADAIQRDGKRLIDLFRARLGAVDDALAADQQRNDDNVTANVDRIAIVVGFGALALVVGGMISFLDQQRSAQRLAEETERAERERRAAAELRAAYETEKRIADTLQEGFSQRPLPTLPTVRFSASYIPATEETRVGGDWYDAVELSGTRVLFTIGDVAGHGLDAAVTMNRARQAVLGSALADGDPAQILARINAEFVRQGAPMVTAIVGIADATRFEFVFATAGHPPPVLVEPGQRARMLEVGGLPLGVVGNATYRTSRVQSVPGAMLVLYTDGAVEHSHDVLEGEQILIEAASTIAELDEREAASAIHRSIFAGRTVGDDVAILTVGFSRERESGLVISAEQGQAAISGRILRAAADPSTAGRSRPAARGSAAWSTANVERKAS